MSAIVNELRLIAKRGHVSSLIVPVLEDAADTIARLEATLEAKERAQSATEDECARLIARLTEELADSRGDL